MYKIPTLLEKKYVLKNQFSIYTVHYHIIKN